MQKTSDYVGTLFEEWRDIPGYEGKYQVSSFGKVRSLDYGGTGAIRELKCCRKKNGYYQINLYGKYKRKTYRIHRLVWEAFRGPIPAGLQINHLDENPANNWLDNLEVCTPSENVNYGTRNERVSNALIGKNVNTPLLSKAVCQIDRRTGDVLNTFPSTREAERFTGIRHTNIANCCNNKPRYKTAGGYKWKYIST